MRSKTRAPRFSVDLNVVCEADGRVWSGRLVDLSESGAFVETTELVPPGTEISLVPDVDDDAELPTEIKAVVVRSDEIDLDDVWRSTQGLAVRLKDTTLQGFSQLRLFLAAHGSRTEKG